LFLKSIRLVLLMRNDSLTLSIVATLSLAIISTYMFQMCYHLVVVSNGKHDSTSVEMEAMERGKSRSLAEEISDKYHSSVCFQRYIIMIIIIFH